MTGLLTDAQMANLQALGELGMTTTAEIYSRSAQAKDPSSPYGDDDVGYATNATVVKAWLVTKPTQELEAGEGQVRALATHQLRVPVGTSVKTGDHVKVNGVEFVVTDATTEQTWPNWTIVFLRGYQ